MSIKPVILDGGLQLVLSPQQAPPGSLRSCQNFEVAHNRGYRKIEGILSYSGGSANSVVDPYVFHNMAGEYGQNMTIDVLDFDKGYVIKWGSGGNFNAATGALTDSDGEATVCFAADHDLGITTFCITNISGRLPAIGDVMLCSGSTITVTDIPRLASEVVLNGGTDVFSNGDNGGTDYANTVDGVSDLIDEFNCQISEFVSAANPIPCNPLGSIKGGFYFKNIAYAVADIETWSFTSGSAEPSAGDIFFLYYTLTAPTGSHVGYIVEKVITESGTWDGGNASGKILLLLTPDAPGSGPASAPKVPTDCRNSTTAVNNPLTIGSLVRSPHAALWKQVSPTFASPTDVWARCDLGYEVRFSGGSEYFTVLNRSNRDTALELGTPSTATAGAGTGAGWTSSSNATGLADTTVATDTNDSGPGPALLLTNYGFSIPDNAVILGVKVTVTRNLTAGGVTEGARDYEIKLSGVASSQNKKRNELWPTALTAVDYGGASDLWDASLSSSIVNSTDFGVSIIVENVNSAGARTRQVDAAVIEITYKDRSSVVYFGDAATTAITSITRASSTATVTTTAPHGFTTGQLVTHTGAAQAEYNITAATTVTGASTYTYTVAGTPATPATGTPVAFRNYSTARAIWYHKEKGDWGSGNDAQGTLTLYEVSAPTAIRTGQVIRATAGASGATKAVAASGANRVYLPPSNALEANASQWEFTKQFNFFGSRGTEQVAGASGADFAFTWDGTYCIRMRTGVDANQDKPRHVAKIGDQLALGYIEGITIVSDLGYPESYAGVVGGTLGGSSPISDDSTTYPLFAGGAQEIKHGDSVYGILPLADQNTAVFCRNSIQMLVGSGGTLVARLVPGSSGIIEYTHADIGIPIFLDYRGIGTLSATAAFGDFQRGRLSDAVAPWLIPRLQQTGSFISKSGPLRSEVVRNKNQYRVYFEDKYVLTMTLVGNDFSSPQFTIQLLPFIPAMTFTGVTSGGKDMFFLAPVGMAEYGASSNLLKVLYEADSVLVPNANLYAPSFFYQGEVGTSWDGRLAIDGFIEVNGGAFGKEWQIDKMHELIVSGQCFGFAPYGAQFGINFRPIDTSYTVNFNGGSTTGLGYLAFSEQTFSEMQNVKLDGYAFSVKFVSSGASVYGATTTQTSPYKFRSFTLQAMIGLDEALKIRRGGS